MNLNGVNSVGFVFEMVNLAMNHIFYSTKIDIKIQRTAGVAERLPRNHIVRIMTRQ